MSSRAACRGAARRSRARQAWQGDCVTESKIQRGIINLLVRRGYEVYRLNSGKVRVGSRWIRLCPAGTPDLLALGRDGRLLWVEVKTTDGKLSRAQQEAHSLLRSRKQAVLVVRSATELDNRLSSTVCA